MKKLFICLFVITLPIFAEKTSGVESNKTQKREKIIYALGESLGALEVDLTNPRNIWSVSGLTITLVSMPFLITAESMGGAALSGIAVGTGFGMVMTNCYRTWIGDDD